MTVSSEVSKTGPYTGNGVTVAFPFGFVILNQNHIKVIRTEAGADTVLTSGFTVSGVGNPSGGTVTFSVAPTAAQKITLLRDLPNTQELDLVNQGAFFAEDVEKAFDLAAMRDQQLQEQVDRAVKVPVGAATSDFDALVADIILVAGKATEVEIVADHIADVEAVADAVADIAFVADNMADVTNFADVYQGPKSSPPTLRNNGSPLQAGDLYFDTTLGNMRVRSVSSTWIASVSIDALEKAQNGADILNKPLFLQNLGLTATAAELNMLDGASPTLAPDLLAAPEAFLGSRNPVINGAFDVWQRGTTVSVDNGYAADRWRNSFIGAGASQTQSRQAFPVGTKLGRASLEYFMRISAVGVAGTTPFNALQQFIEDVRTFEGETVTVLGWARRSAGAGNMAVNFIQFFGAGGSPSTQVQTPGTVVSLTTSWAPFAVTIAIPSISPRTLGTNENSSALVLQFWASAGTSYPTSSGGLGVQTIDIDLAGVHILPGAHSVDSAALYQRPDRGEELRRCQRYYEVGVSTATSGGSSSGWLGDINFKTTKRRAPTMTVLSNIQGALNSFSSISADAAVASHTTSSGVAASTWSADIEY